MKNLRSITRIKGFRAVAYLWHYEERGIRLICIFVSYAHCKTKLRSKYCQPLFWSVIHLLISPFLYSASVVTHVYKVCSLSRVFWWWW